MKHAGFWRRVLAYLIDILPIGIIITAIFYLFFGFDEVVNARFSNPGDFNARVDFLRIRNYIRDLSFAIWIIYSIIFESSKLQATYGKRLIGLTAVDKDGAQLSVFRSLGRNLFKFISLIVLGLGFILVAFTKKKQGWHDLVAGTYIIMNR